MQICHKQFSNIGNLIKVTYEMEKKYLIGALVAAYYCLTLVEACGSSCCQSSSCCSQCASQCQSRTCCDTCNQKCVKADCSNSTSRPDIVTHILDPMPYRPSAPSSTSSINNNTNNSNMTATINITNVIHNDNHISIPININNTNIQSVQILPARYPVVPPVPTPHPMTTPLPVTTLYPVPTSTPTAPHYTTPCPTVTFPVKVPVPVPFPVPNPETGSDQRRCCIVIQPCSVPSCIPYRRECSEQCTSRIMYRPTNPCVGGCYRKEYFERMSCRGMGNCQNYITDCSQCGEDFYRSYGGYQSCGGCFTQR